MCKEHGIDLSAPDITVFAPGNKACAEYSAVYGPLTKAVCAYHVVKGTVGLDSLSVAFTLFEELKIGIHLRAFGTGRGTPQQHGQQ